MSESERKVVTSSMIALGAFVALLFLCVLLMVFRLNADEWETERLEARVATLETELADVKEKAAECDVKEVYVEIRRVD